nr:hypothetical protein [Stenotrophomonas acidaminiphila]
MMVDTSQQHRLECEARDWLRRGYIDAKSVDALIDSIGRKRGLKAANELRQEMRRQWKRRLEWLDATL